MLLTEMGDQDVHPCTHAGMGMRQTLHVDIGGVDSSKEMFITPDHLITMPTTHALTAGT